MAIRGIKDVVDSEIEGRVNTFSFRKNPTQTTVQGYWFDLAQSPGNPIPRYWFGSPLVATPITQSEDGGFYHGGDVSPMTKNIRVSTFAATAATALPMQVILMDYLLVYPLIDDGTTDPQVMDNTQTLPRYTDGAGVQMMAVSVASRTGGATFSVNYTNQDGVPGRVSKTVRQNNVAIIGNIVTSEKNIAANSCFFIPLQEGDTGVRSIESVTMDTADVGLFSIILVKPLGSTQIIEINAPVEVDYLYGSNIIPEVKPDAFLSAICLPNGSLAATGILLDLKVIWG